MTQNNGAPDTEERLIETPESQGEAPADNPVLREIQAANNNVAALRRIVTQQQRQGVPLSAEAEKRITQAIERVEKLEETRRYEQMTPDEELEARRKAMEPKAETPAPATAAVTIDRTAPEIVEALSTYFRGEPLDAAMTVAEQQGVQLTRADIRSIEEYSVKNVPIDRNGDVDWDTYIEDIIKPGVVKMVAARKAVAKPSPAQTVARGALGDSPRPGAGGGSPRLNALDKNVTFSQLYHEK